MLKLIIEARVECTDSDLRREPIRLAVLDGIDDDLEQLGLTLEEGRAAGCGAVGAHIQPHGAVACRARLLPSMLHTVVPQG
jgi:hypothetical protein